MRRCIIHCISLNPLYIVGFHKRPRASATPAWLIPVSIHSTSWGFIKAPVIVFVNVNHNHVSIHSTSWGFFKGICPELLILHIRKVSIHSTSWGYFKASRLLPVPLPYKKSQSTLHRGVSSKWGAKIFVSTQANNIVSIHSTSWGFFKVLRFPRVGEP